MACGSYIKAKGSVFFECLKPPGGYLSVLEWEGEKGKVKVESGKAECGHLEGVLGCPGGALNRKLVCEGKVVWGL